MTLEKFPRARERGPLIFNHKGGWQNDKKTNGRILAGTVEASK